MKDIDLVGGKNASLGEMVKHLARLHLKLPPGFATTTTAFKEFLDENSIANQIYEKIRNLDPNDLKKLKMGNPKDDTTFIGPMISLAEAERLDGWIQSSLKNGAKLLCGGKREGTMLEATLLEDVPTKEDVCPIINVFFPLL